jgi:hypothetical protein
MGLDMYLVKKKYIGGNYSHRNVEGTVKLTIGQELVEIPAHDISEIVMSAGYWRKANQVHNWFVKNVQNGRDECQQSYVSIEQLEQLKGICEAILKARQIHGNDSPEVLGLITETLPPTAGFFFGNTEINEYYFHDLQDTVEILDNLDKSLDYYYEASW